jgi:DNA-binding response OmpR family regulator
VAPRLTDQYILVVEDDADLRELYRTGLRAAGYRVIAVDDGIPALRSVEASRPSAVVLDLGLPRLGGRDVQRELRSHPDTQDVPIVIVSGNDVSDLNPNDFGCVLRKPISSERLILAVQDCLRRWARTTAAT